jgi:hypothetical protein
MDTCLTAAERSGFSATFAQLLKPLYAVTGEAGIHAKNQVPQSYMLQPRTPKKNLQF